MIDVPDPNGVDPERLDRLAKTFIDQKHMTKTSQEREAQIKGIIKSLLDDFGNKDEHGHVWLPGHEYLVKHEARRSVVFNRERAEEFLKSSGDWEEGTELVPEHRELTEDSFSGYMFEHRNDDNAPPLEDFFDVSTNWALKVTEELQAEY